ncbi:MAG: hypothetical protein AB7F67_03785 [Rhodospirillaceae bacterium]
MSAGDVQLKRVDRYTVIDDNASLSNGARAAGDFDNSIGANGDGAEFCTVYLQLQYDGGPPSAGTIVGELWVLPGDGEGSEQFPDGGDAGLGTDDDPQDVFNVGSFQSINPSTSVNEILSLPYVPLHPDGNRFVFKNTSGQTIDSTWQLDIVPFRRTVAQS